MSVRSMISQPLFKQYSTESSYVAKVGLEINTCKTKAFSTFSIPGGQQLPINSKQTENVPQLKCLGLILLPRCQVNGEVTTIIGNVHRTFPQLQQVLWASSKMGL